MLQAWLLGMTQPKRFGCHLRLAVTCLFTCTDYTIIKSHHQGRGTQRRLQALLQLASRLNQCYQFPSIANQSYRRKEHDHESNGQRPQH